MDGNLAQDQRQDIGHAHGAPLGILVDTAAKQLKSNESGPTYLVHR